MVVRGGSRLRQHALGFAVVTRLVGSIHGLHERANLRFGDGGCGHAHLPLVDELQPIVRCAAQNPQQRRREEGQSVRLAEVGPSE